MSHEKEQSPENNSVASRAVAGLVSIMRGKNPDGEWLSMAAGSEGHTTDRQLAVMGLRGALYDSLRERVVGSVDSHGDDALTRFQRALTVQVNEVYGDRRVEQSQQVAKHRQSLEEQLRAERELKEEDSTRYVDVLEQRLARLDEAPEEVIPVTPIKFITDYHGINGTVDRKNPTNDNALIYGAIMEAATRDDSSVDESLAEALNGLLPSKMLIEVGSDSATIRIDGQEITLSDSAEEV